MLGLIQPLKSDLRWKHCHLCPSSVIVLLVWYFVVREIYFRTVSSVQSWSSVFVKYSYQSQMQIMTAIYIFISTSYFGLNLMWYIGDIENSRRQREDSGCGIFRLRSPRHLAQVCLFVSYIFFSVDIFNKKYDISWSLWENPCDCWALRLARG